MLINLNLENGIEISKVYKDSPAEAAGLQDEDIILSFAGKEIHNTEDLIKLVRGQKVGDQVEVEYLREGKRNKVQVKLGPGPQKKITVREPRVPRVYHMTDVSKTWLGIQTTGLTEQLRVYFGAPEDLGLLIKEVVKDSPAEKAGLKAGDVLIKVANKKVRGLKDVQRAINYFDPGDEIEVSVLRDKKEKAFKVKLEERKQDDRIYFYGENNDHWSLPAIPEIDVEVPEFEIVPEDFDVEVEPLLEDVPAKLEWQMQGMDEKLKNLDEKLKKLEIKVVIDESI
jgi:S1-C subfamily serine protease